MIKSYNNLDFFSHQPYLEYNMNYISFRPTDKHPLAGLIWEAYQVDDFDSTKEIALPDICADIMTLYTNDRAYCYLMGGTDTSRSMRDIEFIDEVKSICGIKFRPGTIGNLFLEPVCDAGGDSIAAEDIMYKGGQVVRDLKSAEIFEDRMQILGNYLMERMNDGYEVDYLASYVTRRIMETHGLIRLSDLAEETGYTDRYLRKVMGQKLGMKMKTFGQIVQMQWSYHLGKEELSDSNMALLAQMCGYYDQSHMNATYKKLTGMLPRDAFRLYNDSL